MAQAIHGKSLSDQFVKAGIVPENCRRIILDICCDDVAKIYYECHADTRTLEIDIPSMIKKDLKCVVVPVEDM